MTELTNCIGFTDTTTNAIVYSKLSVLSTIAAACFKSEFKLPVREMKDFTNQNAMFLGCSSGQWFKALILPESLDLLLPESFMFAPFGWLVIKNKEWLEPLKRVELAYDTVETLRDESNRDYLFITEHYEKALAYLKQSKHKPFTIDFDTYYGEAEVRDRINYRRQSSEREGKQLENELKQANKSAQFVSLEDYSPFAILRLLKENKLERTAKSTVYKVTCATPSIFSKLKLFIRYFTTQQFVLLT